MRRKRSLRVGGGVLWNRAVGTSEPEDRHRGGTQGGRGHGFSESASFTACLLGTMRGLCYSAKWCVRRKRSFSYPGLDSDLDFAPNCSLRLSSLSIRWIRIQWLAPESFEMNSMQNTLQTDFHFFILSCMSSPSQSPLPPPSPPDPSRSSQCTRSECLSHASNLGWWSVSP